MTSVVFVSEKDYFKLATGSGNYSTSQCALSPSGPGCFPVAGRAATGLAGVTPGSAPPSPMALGCSFSVQTHKAEWRLVFCTFNK